MTPPRLALLLLHLLLPRDLREPIAGDLEEEWRATPRPSRPRFWLLALRSVGACAIDRLRADPYRRERQAPLGTGDSPMRSLLQDLRYGSRLMWRNPAFTFAAVATLALGIGANSAIFTVVNVITLKPLPYHDPSRVAFVLGWDTVENEMRFNLRRADVLDLQRQATSFGAVSAYTYVSANLTGGDMPDRVQAYRVTANTFPMLGVPAALGRVFDETDVKAGREDLAVISHGLWQRRFGGDPAVVGRRIVVNGEPREVVGVMPARFEYPVFNFKGDLWVPWLLRDAERGQADARRAATVVGRLRDGVSYRQAQTELDLLMASLADRHPDTNRDIGARLTEMGKLDDEQAGPAIAILLVTVALVLLLACANVANLLLARGISRHRELAVRSAIGASRLRIGRQLLVEGVLLAMAGGAFGVVLAVAAVRGIRASLPDALLATMPNVQDMGVDATTLGYTLAISLLTSLVFGVLPAWRASREDFDGALQESASAGGGRGTRRLRGALVVSEVALATLLLIGAGLLTRSYAGLQQIDPGFDATGVMSVTVSLPDYKYPDADARRRFYEDVLERVGRVPAVVSAGFVNVLPFSTYDDGTRITVDGDATPEPGREPVVSYRVSSPGYHEAMRIPLVDGRFFDSRDHADGAPAVIVNQALAARYLKGAGGSATTQVIGRRIRLGAPETPWRTIVGVVGDVRHSTLTEAVQPEVYLPMAQAPPAMMMLAARSAAAPEDLTGPIRAAVNDVDAAQPVYHVKTLETLVGESMLPSSVSAGMMSLFGLLALVLSAIGVYGVVAYGVTQQSREFGVRLALGATPGDVLRLVLRGGALMVGAGIAVGVAAAVAVSRLLEGALVGVSPTDPLSYVTAAAVLGLTATVACLVPAWRASLTKPASALRTE